MPRYHTLHPYLPNADIRHKHNIFIVQDYYKLYLDLTSYSNIAFFLFQDPVQIAFILPWSLPVCDNVLWSWHFWYIYSLFQLAVECILHLWFLFLFQSFTFSPLGTHEVNKFYLHCLISSSEKFFQWFSLFFPLHNFRECFLHLSFTLIIILYHFLLYHQH